MNCLDRSFVTPSAQRPGRSRRFLVWVTLLLVAPSSFILSAKAQHSEYDVKAAFIANFVKFVRWPAGALPDANAPLTIGILGNDPFGGALDRSVHEQSAGGRKMNVRRGRRVEDLRGCQVVFIGSSVGNLGQTLAALPGNVLTISDIPGFTRQGGMIGFVMEGDKVGFEINSANAQRAGLEITSRLLRLAKGAG
ncbi:MAG: YfiR family protein [Verrucomicrobiota bacterium]|nr:YfiR family protein [Verrucomicrobiota bacterium]